MRTNLEFTNPILSLTSIWWSFLSKVIPWGFHNYLVSDQKCVLACLHYIICHDRLTPAQKKPIIFSSDLHRPRESSRWCQKSRKFSCLNLGPCPSQFTRFSSKNWNQPFSKQYINLKMQRNWCKKEKMLPVLRTNSAIKIIKVFPLWVRSHPTPPPQNMEFR